MSEANAQNNYNVQLIPCFASSVYSFDLSQYKDKVLEVADEYMKLSKDQNNETYPTFMSPSFYGDERLGDFGGIVAQLGWDILSAQGYAVQQLQTTFESMWMQEHYKHSNMEYHVHGAGVQLVAFYFLNLPKGSSQFILHDPRAGKVQLDLYENDRTKLTDASSRIVFQVKEGHLYITNAFLPHSFTNHESDEPMKFLHINLAVEKTPVVSTDVEVV
jgi:Putative 2OG-Fe(II) oxygenase